MSETLLRQWEMLRSIPRAPRKIDAGALMARLEGAGYRITKRTLQRDLNLLSGVFPLQSDTRNTPYGWSWSADAPTFDLPAMDGPTALTVRMIEQFIPSLLPPSIHEILAPQFSRARAVLDANPNNPLGRWTGCVRVVPQGMQLLAPKVNSDATRFIYQALLDRKRIQMTYTPRSSEGEGDLGPPDVVTKRSRRVSIVEVGCDEHGRADSSRGPSFSVPTSQRRRAGRFASA